MSYLYDSFDNVGLNGNDMLSPRCSQALVSEQFYRNQGRFAGPLVDYTELQRGMHSFSYSSYNSYDRMSIDVFYYTEYDNKITFTFNVNDFYFNQNNTMVGDVPADLFTNTYLFKLDLCSIKQERDNIFAGDGRMFHCELPSPINIKYAPQSYFRTHHEIKDIVFMTDLMMDVFYGDNKYKLDKDKINNVEYLSKVKTIQDKLNEIEKDFK